MYRVSSAGQAADQSQIGRLGVTLRQAEVLLLVSAGLTDKEIGARLGVTSRSVSKHLERIYRQLRLRNRADAAAAWTSGRIQSTISNTPLI